MHEKSIKMLHSTGINQPRRFSVAFALSLVVNLLFLIGAGTLLRTDGKTTPDATDYITLERIEISPSEPVALPNPVSAGGPDAPLLPADIPAKTVARSILKALPVPSIDTSPRKVTLPLPLKPYAAPRAPEIPEAVEATTVAETNSQPSVGEAGGDTSESKAAEDAGSVKKGLPEITTPTPNTSRPEPAASTEATVPTPAKTATPIGETRGAEIAHQELPQIPDFIRDGDYNPSVQVAVEVLPNGTFSVTLRTSSGNPAVDTYVLNALKQWKWKPALKDGEPVASTQLLKFDFASN